MRPNELKPLLSGVMAFSVTPFMDDQALDLEALTRHVDWMSRSGVHSIAVAGAVGEFYALTFDEYRDVIEASLRAAGGRVPVLIGIGHSTRMATELARVAADAGAAGLLVNPLYVAVPGVDGLLRHHEALAGAADLGQIVFSTRGTPYGPDALERLAEIDHVVGLKDELGDLDLFLACVERLGERLVWINGMAEPYTSAYFAVGATCMTTGLANFAPRIPLAIVQAAATGDYELANSLVHRQVSAIAALRKKRPGYSVAIIKAAMELLGHRAGPCRLPLVGVQSEDLDVLRRVIHELEIETEG